MARNFSLSVYDNLEVLECYLHSSAVNTLVIVVYRPGSATVANAFFDDFNSILDRATTFASSLGIIGDVNIHLDAATDPNTIRFNQALYSHGLVQHVVGPTHHRGHTLDILITRKDVADPPGDVVSFFACYDETLKSLVDQYAPLIR